MGSQFDWTAEMFEVSKVKYKRNKNLKYLINKNVQLRNVQYCNFISYRICMFKLNLYLILVQLTDVLIILFHFLVSNFFHIRLLPWKIRLTFFFLSVIQLAKCLICFINTEDSVPHTRGKWWSHFWHCQSASFHLVHLPSLHQNKEDRRSSKLV